MALRRRTTDDPQPLKTVGAASMCLMHGRTRSSADISRVGAEVVEQRLLGDLDQPAYPYHRSRPLPVTHQLVGQSPADAEQSSCLGQIKDR
jgi:hypothetical protein